MNELQLTKRGQAAWVGQKAKMMGGFRRVCRPPRGAPDRGDCGSAVVFEDTSEHGGTAAGTVGLRPDKLGESVLRQEGKKSRAHPRRQNQAMPGAEQSPAECFIDACFRSSPRLCKGNAKLNPRRSAPVVGKKNRKPGVARDFAVEAVFRAGGHRMNENKRQHAIFNANLLSAGDHRRHLRA